MQRILVGVVGLSVILLAAALGSLVFSALADPSDPAVNKVAAEGQAGEEPLVELGVVPGNPEVNATSATAPAPPPATAGQQR